MGRKPRSTVSMREFRPTADGNGSERSGQPLRKEKTEMEQNEHEMENAPAAKQDSPEAAGGCCGGRKGSNKIVIVIWVTLLLCVVGYLA